jgi:hypothetical protein
MLVRTNWGAGGRKGRSYLPTVSRAPGSAVQSILRAGARAPTAATPMGTSSYATLTGTP